MTANRTHLLLFSALLTGSTAGSAWAQRADTLRPGENLVVDGVPPIPAALAERVRRYTEYRSATLADWHPTQRHMLISIRFGNTNQVHRVRTPGGARAQLTFYDEPITNGDPVSPRVAGTSSSERMWGATSSPRSTATTWPAAMSPC